MSSSKLIHSLLYLLPLGALAIPKGELHSRFIKARQAPAALGPTDPQGIQWINLTAAQPKPANGLQSTAPISDSVFAKIPSSNSTTRYPINEADWNSYWAATANAGNSTLLNAQGGLLSTSVTFGRRRPDYPSGSGGYDPSYGPSGGGDPSYDPGYGPDDPSGGGWDPSGGGGWDPSGGGGWDPSGGGGWDPSGGGGWDPSGGYGPSTQFNLQYGIGGRSGVRVIIYGDTKTMQCTVEVWVLNHFKLLTVHGNLKNGIATDWDDVTTKGSFSIVLDDDKPLCRDELDVKLDANFRVFLRKWAHVGVTPRMLADFPYEKNGQCHYDPATDPDLQPSATTDDGPDPGMTDFPDNQQTATQKMRRSLGLPYQL